MARPTAEAGKIVVNAGVEVEVQVTVTTHELGTGVTAA